MGDHDAAGAHRDATDPILLRSVIRHVRWGWVMLTFAVNLLGFAVVGSWLLARYTSDFEGRVLATETAVASLSSRVSNVEARQSALNTSIAVLETRSEAQSQTLERIETGVQDLARELRGQPARN